MLVKAPRPGLVKTRLVPPLDLQQAAALALAFTMDLATRLGALAPVLGATPFMFYSPDNGANELRAFAGEMTLRPQGAGDLGHRMCAIVAALRAEGFAHVVLVGADAPTLPDACISGAFEALDSGVQVAIARADDRGYVLLGVDAPYAALFESIPWSTHLVYATTVMRARADGLTVGELPGWYDVDTAGDLARVRLECMSGTGTRAPHTRKVLENLRF